MSASNADRRTIIGAGALIAGAGMLAAAPARAASDWNWTPVSEDKDAWMDIPGTRHRMVYDTISGKAFNEAMFYARNYYEANQSGYGLAPATLGVIIIARHMSTPFAYADPIWAKYGATFAKVMGLEGDQAELAKTANPVFADSGEKGPDGQPMPTVSSMAAKGARFAVCGMATTFIAGLLAKDSDQSAKDIEADLAANLVPNGVMVPAGIVAVNRAQEHGYAFAYVA